MSELREGDVYDLTIRDSTGERTLEGVEYLGLAHQEMSRTPTSPPQPDLHVFVHQGERLEVAPRDLLRAVRSSGGPDPA